MIGVLEKALNAKFTATTSLTNAFTGNMRPNGTSVGLHWDMATSGVAVPYLVAQVLSAPAITRYGGVSRADITVQFKAFGIGRAATQALMQTLVGVLDEFIPTLDSGTVCNAVRESEPFVMELPQRETQGRNEYQGIVNYVYSVAP